MSLAEVIPEATPSDSLFDWPLFGLQDDVRPVLAEAAARGERAVLATLYGVNGAAPRGVGAQMVFTEETACGFLSGGCIEADLMLHASHVLACRRAQRVTYGEGGPVDIRLPCGSRIEVLLEPIGKDDAAVARLLQLQRERRPALWLTTGDQRLCVAAGDADALPAAFRAVAASARSKNEACGYEETPFAVYRAFAPRRRLMVIGGDPIALAVVKLATKTGFETILVRPQGPETCPIPGVIYHRSDACDAIASCRPDAWTAVAILTHDIEQEHAALRTTLGTNAGYIGVLGSRRRAPQRVVRLIGSGVSDENIRRVHAPIGLPIGSKSPWEIAISVIAEVVRDLDATHFSKSVA